MPAGAALGRYRVCDFTTGLIGPAATRWLAAFGAEVIKIEDVHNPDPARLIGPFRPPGPEADGPGAVFNNLNVGKRGAAFDLNSRRGRRLAAELAAHCDLVCVDHPGLDALGIDGDLIRRLRAGNRGPLVIATAPANPDPSLGRRRADRQPETARTDAGEVTWMGYAVAILGALAQARELGRDVEFSCSIDAVDLADGSDNGDRPVDARHLHRCCDGWVAVDCRDNQDREALATVIGSGHRTVEEWTRSRSRWTVERELQRVGVPAAAVRAPHERIDGDIATGSRRLWPMVDHPEMGGVRVEGIPVELSKSGPVISEPAPAPGQDTQSLLVELLGHDEDELGRLQLLGVTP